MFKIKYLLVSLFLLANVSGYTQYIGKDDEGMGSKKEKNVRETRVKNSSVRKQNKNESISAIRQLKNGGALLFMVRESQANMQMLREKGYTELATQREEVAQRRNLFFVRALARKFSFCPVYFFYQSDLEKIQKGEYLGNFLDTNLVRQPGLDFKHSYFLILDYGDQYNEPGKVYSDTARADISGRLAVREDCFVFKNKYLSQLMDPFPEPVHCEIDRNLQHLHRTNQELGLPKYQDTQNLPEADKTKLKLLQQQKQNLERKIWTELYVKIRRINKRLNKFNDKHAS